MINFTHASACHSGSIFLPIESSIPQPAVLKSNTHPVIGIRYSMEKRSILKEIHVSRPYDLSHISIYKISHYCHQELDFKFHCLHKQVN